MSLCWQKELDITTRLVHLSQSLSKGLLISWNKADLVLLGNRNQTGGVRVPINRMPVNVVMWFDIEAVQSAHEDQVQFTVSK